MPGEVYRHVPDLSWVGWPRVTRLLYEMLSRPATTDEVVEWSRGQEIVFDGTVGSYVRNMLAWLSLQGKVDHVGGKWRRIDT